MKNTILDTFKLFSNKVFKTNFLTSYENQYLNELHSAIKFVGTTEDAFELNPAARYRMDN